MYFNIGEAPLEEISWPFQKKRNIRLFMKREDLLHPHISGNKWRKLKYNLLEARKAGFHTLLTFGGAYSNHIYAVAATGAEFGFKTIGVIRGEPKDRLNPTLAFAVEKGMVLHFVSREEYQLKHTDHFQKQLYDKFGDFFLIPEGGANILGVKGCMEIVKDINIDFDYICTACGTGSTMAGLIAGLQGKSKILGFPALKGGDFLKDDIRKFLAAMDASHFENWELITSYHFGGYAKFKPELIDFINEFYQINKIQLDPVYTGKMMYGIYDLAGKGFFKEGSTIIALHTGGLQGIEGFNERFGGIIKK